MPEATPPAAPTPTAATPTSAPAPTTEAKPVAAPATPDAPATPADAPKDAAAPAEATPAAPKPGEKAQATLERLRAANARKREEREARTRAEQVAQRETWQRQQAEERAKAAQQEAEQLKAQYQKVKDDPYSFLEAAGIEPKDVVERAKADADPLKQLAKQVEAANKRAEALEAKLKERDDATERERKRVEQETHNRGVEEAFVKTALDEKRFPNVAQLAKKDPELVLARAHRLIDQISKRAQSMGQPVPNLPDEEILAYLNNHWSESGASSTAPTSQPAATSAKAPAPSLASSTAHNAGSSTTLTNTDATERGSLATPPEKMSRAEENRYWAQQYRRLREQGRA